jgi:hypothetical protein
MVFRDDCPPDATLARVGEYIRNKSRLPTGYIGLNLGDGWSIVQFPRHTPNRREVWDDIKDSIVPKQHVAVKPNTMVAVTCEYRGHFYHGHGFARCNRKDEWNENTGYTIAEGRAKKDLLDTIMAAQKGGV